MAAGIVVMFGPGLLPRPMSGSATLLQSWSVLMLLSLVIAKGQKVKVVHIWPRLLLAAALGRIDPAPHQLQHSGELTLLLAWAAKSS